jgi:hypothetical protein
MTIDWLFGITVGKNVIRLAVDIAAGQVAFVADRKRIVPGSPVDR